MEFKEYQEFVFKSFSFEGKPTLANPTDCYSQVNQQIVALGLAGESGEVLEILKKAFRDKNGKLSPEDIVNLRLELGDVLWHIAAIAEMYGLTLSDIAFCNIKKLTRRNETKSK